MGYWRLHARARVMLFSTPYWGVRPSMYLSQRYRSVSTEAKRYRPASTPTLVLPVSVFLPLMLPCPCPCPCIHARTRLSPKGAATTHSPVHPRFPCRWLPSRMFLYIYVIRRSSFPPGLLHVNDLPSLLPHGAAPQPPHDLNPIQVHILEIPLLSFANHTYTSTLPPETLFIIRLRRLGKLPDAVLPPPHRPLKFMGTTVPFLTAYLTVTGTGDR